jgi:hypothetical protein
MATPIVAIALSGSTVSPFTAALMMAAASAVDSYFILPSLQKSAPRAEFGSFDVNYAEEGSPGYYVYGEKNRVPGHIIACSTPTGTTARTGSSKRGGAVTTTWWSDVVVVFAHNQIYRTERIDFEGNSVYRRDPNRDMKLDYATAPLKFEQFFDSANSVVQWKQNTNGTWDLVRWDWIVQNRTSPTTAFLYPSTYVVGQKVEVSVRDSSAGSYGNVIFGAGGSHEFAMPFYTSYGSAWYKKATWSFTVISSRNHGMVSGTNIPGNTVTVPRSRLQVDLLAEIRGSTAVGNKSFFVGVTTAQKNNFKPWGVDNPLSYPDVGQAYKSYNLDTWIPGHSQVHIAVIQTGEVYATDTFRNNSLVTQHTGAAQTGVGWAGDATYTRMKGAQWTPNFPRMCYWGMRDMNISKFGNRIPQMQAYVDAREYTPNGRVTLTKTRMIEILCNLHAQIPSYLYDLDDVLESTLSGFNFAGLQEPRTLLAPLLIAGDIQVAEYGGKMRFKSRNTRETVTIGWHHLDARDWNAPPTQMLAIEDQNMRQMPRRVHVRFTDVDKDHQTGDVYASKDTVVGRFSQSPRSDADLVTTQQISLAGLPLNSSEASAIAQRVLTDAQEMRQRVRLRLPCWYINLIETDIIKIAASEVVAGSRGHISPPAYATRYQDRDYYVLIEQLDIGADFFVEIDGWLLEEDGWVNSSFSGVDSPPGHTFTVSTEEDGSSISGANDDVARAGGSDPSKIAQQPPSVLSIMDIPPMLDAHCNKCGVYFAYTQPGSGQGFASPHLFEGIGGGNEWENIGAANSPVIMGKVVGAFESGTQNVFDPTVTLTVDLDGRDVGNNVLESSTEEDVLNGANYAAVGHGSTWEIIAFVTATEVTDESLGTSSRWQLANLRRGLWGTEDQIATHVDGEVFVLLDRHRLHFHQLDTSLVGLTRAFKLLNSGQADADAADLSIDLVGKSSLSLPVANLVAWRKSNGDVVFTWDRRARARYRTFGTQQAPLVEVTESYDVVIDLSSDRTINVSSETATYTAAMQSSDSTSGAEITATVYQRDSVRGRGQAKQIIAAGTQKEVGTQDGNVIGTEDGKTLNTPLGGGMD